MAVDNILETGPLTYREIQELNKTKSQQADNGLLKALGSTPKVSPAESTRRYLQNLPDYENLPSVGYGESKYDKRAWNTTQLENLEEFRAQQQSFGDQLANGVGKALMLTGTTFADTFAGTVAGLFNILKEGGEGNIDNWRDVGNAFIHNVVSDNLQKLNDWSERVMPNRETQAEQELPWWEKVFTANFIGDHFIKNLGFFTGAYLSGRATASLLTKAIKLNETKKLFEGAVKAAGIEIPEGQSATNALLKGQIQITDDALREALLTDAKAVKNAQLTTKITSSIMGSMGESRIEAITGSNQDFERDKKTLDENFRNYINGGVDDEIAEENPSWYTYVATRNTEGNITGYKRVPANIKAEQEKARRIAEKEQKYNQALEQLVQNKIDYANSTFLMNMLVLASDYMFQFGDAFVGGFGKSRTLKGLVNIVEGKYKSTAKRVAAKELGLAALSPVIEGTQEMFQEGIQQGSERYYGNKLNSIYGEPIDDAGLRSTGQYVSDFLGGLASVYSDPEQWENFALGFLTGFVPMPGRVARRDENGNLVVDDKGREKYKWQAQNEFYQGLRNARDAKKQADLDAKALNDLHENDSYRAMYMNMARQSVDTDIQQKALVAGDAKTYKDAEYDKLVSRVLTYLETGRYQDLLDEIEKIYTIEDKDIADVKALTRDNKTGISIYDGKTNKEIIDGFAKQKEKLLEKVQHIKDVAESIDRIYGNTFTRPGYNLLVSYATTIDDREERIKQISQEVLDYFNHNIALVNRVGSNRMKILKDINELALFIDKNGKGKSRLEILDENRGRAPWSAAYYEAERKAEKVRVGVKEATEEDYTKLGEALATLNEITNELNNGELPLGMPEQLKDLGELLVERESLITSLNDYSRNPEKLEDGLWKNISDAVERRANKFLKHNYDIIAKLGTKQEKVLAIKQSVSSQKYLDKLKKLADDNGDTDTKEAISDLEKLNKEYDTWNNVLESYNKHEDYRESAQAIQKQLTNLYAVASDGEEFKNLAIGLLDTLSADESLDPKDKALIKDIKEQVDSSKKTQASKEEGKKNESENKGKKLSKNVVKNVNKLLNSKDVDKDIAEFNNGQLREILADSTIQELVNPEGNINFFEGLSKEDIRNYVSMAIQDLINEGVTDFEAYVNGDTFEGKEEDTEQEPKDTDAAKNDETPVSAADAHTEGFVGETETEEDEPVEITNLKPSSKTAETNGEDLENEDIKDVLYVNNQGAKYDFNALADKATRKLVLNTKHWATRVLELCKTQDYIDSGELADLIENAKRTGTQLKFRFVQIKGNHFGDESIAKANAEAANTLFLAVELPTNDKNEPVNKNGKTSWSYVSGIGIDQKVPMQVLGVVSYPKNATTSQKNRFKKLLNTVKEQVSNITIPSEESSSHFVVVASNITTQIEKIFSGRFVKSNDAFPEVGERDFKELATDDDGNLISQEGKIQLVAFREGGANPIVIGKSLGGEIVPLNNLRELSPLVTNSRKGTPWIRVKEADGRVYYKAVRIKNYNTDWNEDGSKYDKFITDAVTKLKNAKTKDSIFNAISDLHRAIYIPKNKKLFVSLKNRTLRRGNDSIDLNTATIEEIKDFIKSQDYRFSFGNNSATLDEIIASNILSTDLAQIRNANASLLASEVEVFDDGKVSIIPSETVKELVATGKTHTGSRVYRDTENFGPQITFGNDGTIYRQKGFGPQATYWTEDNGVRTPVSDTDLQFKISFATKIATGQAESTTYYIATKGHKAVRVYKCTDNDGNLRYMTSDYQLLSEKEVDALNNVLKQNSKKDKALKQLQTWRDSYKGSLEERKEEKPKEPETPETPMEQKPDNTPVVPGAIPPPRRKRVNVEVSTEKQPYVNKFNGLLRTRTGIIEFGKILRNSETLRPLVQMEAVVKVINALDDNTLKKLDEINWNEDQKIKDFLKKVEAIVKCL